jgi:hypothetical protein
MALNNVLETYWRIDLLGGLVYSAFVFSLFYRSLVWIDRAYALGVSGGNGWQRLFEDTKLQYFFDEKPESGYEVVMQESIDGESARTSVDQLVYDRREDDLEAAWIENLGAIWKVKDPVEDT